MAYRQLKRRIGDLLGQDDFTAALETIGQLPGRQAINPLFGFFYSGDETIRWRAITAMGTVVCQLAETAMESARVVMRRLMWNLNDESGGIGWGSPEAMGEITAGHAGLAGEYGRILISYIDPAGNFLEYEQLQRGSLWGVGRLAHARPVLVQPAADHLCAFFDAADPTLRGTAIWAAAPILNPDICTRIAAHGSDDAPLRLYRQMRITKTTVAELARAALAGCGQHD
ncbi:DVU0298 family protein [Desulfosarcina ovata]|uniref:HEAT repeat domain-containing protein n=1 Tax=Desulfosarcina ovata subsp. ovata TaxID=2752305 RepID=A0A5K8AF07_9BACT|nr:DVU0298 family protein [Desulfosarcina ovata]BBO91177.1 hypothetical protein DSCOOX_43570 [Desulfosarcina ovata subsp. ovata]